MQAMISNGIKKGQWSEQNLKSTSQKLQKATERYEKACALKSERESVFDLTKEILDLTTINPTHPEELNAYLIAKRKMLEIGYKLSQSQTTLQQTLKTV